MKSLPDPVSISQPRIPIQHSKFVKITYWNCKFLFFVDHSHILARHYFYRAPHCTHPTANTRTSGDTAPSLPSINTYSKHPNKLTSAHHVTTNRCYRHITPSGTLRDLMYKISNQTSHTSAGQLESRNFSDLITRLIMFTQIHLYS